VCLQKNHLLKSKKMARQKGIIKIKGTVGGMSFYKTQDGDLVREKSSLDGDRIKNDAAFARTRENGAEFGSSASAGKLLRDALRPLLLNAADNRAVSRITKVMTTIKNLDGVSVRGKRSVGVAIAQPAAKALLKGFNFNIKAVLGAVLFKPYSIVPATGIITINQLVPINDIAYPTGATHVTFSGAWAKVDFTAGMFDVQYSPPQTLPIDATLNDVLLPPPGTPAGGPSATSLFLLGIEFLQEVNGVKYSLKNGAYNALCILDAQ
jgi:hypothetical protein